MFRRWKLETVGGKQQRVPLILLCFPYSLQLMCWRFLKESSQGESQCTIVIICQLTTKYLSEHEISKNIIDGCLSYRYNSKNFGGK